MLIYRMEDKISGIGPFGYLYQTLTKQYGNNSHPGPHRDGLSSFMDERNRYGDVIFGCHTLPKLREWFIDSKKKLMIRIEDSGDRWVVTNTNIKETNVQAKKDLKEHRMVVNVYRIEPKHTQMGLSRKQIVFDKRHAVLDHTITLDEFFSKAIM